MLAFLPSELFLYLELGLNVGLLLALQFLAIFGVLRIVNESLFSSTAEQAELVYSYRIHFDRPLSQV
ncbi:hypothetical protein BOX15_Mlig022671g2 [Macrostomum lignano]|uniref:Uncharacterized protein n=1 Tax=Macrostomum lignano TaxID=282301 RepID=A0A267G0X2_9PLAT|nr:hypothetical protein BOX15_Mlig022671g2 [Macrostomum lignano]